MSISNPRDAFQRLGAQLGRQVRVAQRGREALVTEDLLMISAGRLRLQLAWDRVVTVEQRPANPDSWSQLVVRVPCAHCQASLVPISSGETVTFYCDNAHETTLEQFLELYSETGNASMLALMNAWRKSAAALELVAKEAQSRGHHKAVEVFQRHIGNLEARIELLRNAAGKKPPI